jgi:hypothetical protein
MNYKLEHETIYVKHTLLVKKSPNTACSRRVGVCTVYKHFAGFEFFLLMFMFLPGWKL